MRTTLLLCACALSLTAAEPTFKAVDVDTKVEIGYGVTVADVNGDKKPDILLADKNLIVWYENPSWTKHIIAEKLTKQDHVCIAAADVDGDGKAEVAVGAEWNPGDTVNSGAVFYLLAPEDRTQKWEAIPLHHEPTVHRMRWVNGNLIVVPLHGRGNKAGAGAGVKILAYRKPADVKQPWPTEVLDETLHMTHNLDPVQWDTDPEKEMLIASKEGVFLLKNKKLSQLSGTQSAGAGEVRLGKLANGKLFFATVEPMHGTNLVVYREAEVGLGAHRENVWIRKVLDSTLVDGHALACGDLAKSGSDQIVVGWRAMGKPGVKVGIKMFTPQDNEGKEWKETLVDDNKMACEDLTLADLDGDGRLDIVAAGRATKNLKIYWNGAR
ncbi:MAG TPA: FG-GAP and VCBS repeat-containing protein [Verrucomicrobiae bacterium]|nr:FG-GAP and VCBS repeat-containing protein [Verrucomicrobiae bacterium]